jgi:transposase-like protein
MEEERSKTCIYCNSLLSKTKRRDEEVLCSWQGCKKKYNLWMDTILFNSRICNVKNLIILEYFFQKAPIRLIRYITHINTKTISRLLKRTAKFLIPKVMNCQDKIGGNNSVVEIDESKFGKRKYNRGHRVEGVWILGMIEKTGQKRIRLLTLENRTKDGLLELIKQHVKQDTIIYTDGRKGYNGLNEYFSGHFVVNHSIHFVDPNTSVHTNTIEGSWTAVQQQTPLRNRSKNKVCMFLVRYMLLKDTSEHPLKILPKYLF